MVVQDDAVIVVGAVVMLSRGAAPVAQGEDVTLVDEPSLDEGICTLLDTVAVLRDGVVAMRIHLAMCQEVCRGGATSPKDIQALCDAYDKVEASVREKKDAKCTLSAEFFVVEQEDQRAAAAAQHKDEDELRTNKAVLKRLEKRKEYLGMHLVASGVLDERDAEELARTYDSVEKLTSEVAQGEARMAAAAGGCGKRKHRDSAGCVVCGADDAVGGKGKARLEADIVCMPNVVVHCSGGGGRFDAEASGSDNAPCSAD